MNRKVTVVGGGTAGWLTACLLAKKLDSDKIQIEVVESPDIPTIGVGEGTWPTMRKTLETIGVDETSFIRACDATFKQGTRFDGWVGPSSSGSEENSYYHLFCSIVNPADFNLAPYWLDSQQKRSYLDTVSAQGVVCKNNLAPKKITSKAYEAVQSYGYHFDAAKIIAFLREHATTHLNVSHLSANVLEVVKASDDSIDFLKTDADTDVHADLFVDCTGFKSLLLGQSYGVPFHSIQDVLFTNKAVTMQVPYETPLSEIPCNTISTAHEAGWLWEISLRSRRGVGCVYSSDFMSKDRAEQVLRSYVGKAAQGLEARHINMETGYREKFWHKNCVAVGLSAAFIEPLEASAIFLVEAAAKMIAELFPSNSALMESSGKSFNQSFRFRWDRTIEFIKLHYYLSKREEPFWQANKNPNSVPAKLLENLEKWQFRPVSSYDFTDSYEPFAQESYQFVMYGMGFKPDEKIFSASRDHELASGYLYAVEGLGQHLSKDLPSHRELIEKLQAFEFQKI